MENAHARTVDEIASIFTVKTDVGLDIGEVVSRQKKYGPNG